MAEDAGENLARGREGIGCGLGLGQTHGGTVTHTKGVCHPSYSFTAVPLAVTISIVPWLTVS